MLVFFIFVVWKILSPLVLSQSNFFRLVANSCFILLPSVTQYWHHFTVLQHDLTFLIYYYMGLFSLGFCIFPRFLLHVVWCCILSVSLLLS